VKKVASWKRREKKASRFGFVELAYMERKMCMNKMPECFSGF